MRVVTSSPLLMIAAVVLVSCGGGGGATAGASAKATAGGSAAGSAPAGSTTVAAEEKEFAIDLDNATVPQGDVTFKVNNAGTVVHEFVVVDTDTAAAQLPQASDGVVDEDALTVVDEIEDLAPGVTENLTVNLPAGHYVVLCNIPGHYASGMHIDLTVQ
jgi:uncharacterized cupredoxin-like copper-binding protein